MLTTKDMEELDAMWEQADYLVLNLRLTTVQAEPISEPLRKRTTTRPELLDIEQSIKLDSKEKLVVAAKLLQELTLKTSKVFKL